MPYELTWQFDANRIFNPPTAADLTKYQMWYLASFLLGYIGGATLGLWTVAGCSDGVTGSMDGTFRWGTPGTYDGTKIVQVTATPASSAHSWIILKSPTMPDGGNVYILIDAYQTVTSGYSEFTTRTPWALAATSTFSPVNVDMIPTTITTGNLVTNDATTTTRFFNGCLATNGNFIVFDCKQGGGVPNFMTIWANTFNPNPGAPGDLFPFFHWRYESYTSPGVGILTARNASVVATNAARSGVNGAVGYNFDPFVATAINGVASKDLITGGVLNFPSHIMWSDGSSNGHYRGRLQDISNAPVDLGNNYPVVVGYITESGAIKFAIFGSLIIPFNTTVQM